MRIEGSTVIARPVEDVFDFVADERNEPRYNPRMVRAVKLTPGPIQVGTRWGATIESGGRPVDMTIEVTDYDRPFRLGNTTTMSAGQIHGGLTFVEGSAGTTVAWDWDLVPKGVFRMFGPLLARMGRRQEAEIWHGLKEYLEHAPSRGGSAGT